MPFHSFFGFLVLVVNSSHPITVSFIFSQHNGDSLSPLLVVIFWLFFWFPRCQWVWPLIWIAAYIRNILLSGHIVAIYPPWKPASGLVLCSGGDAVDGDRSCRNTAPLSPLLAVGGPPVKNRPGSIIWEHRADIPRRWEHPRDLVSTLLWPSAVSLLSTPQLLGNRGISPIDSSGRTQLLGVEGNYESAAVFTGR